MNDFRGILETAGTRGHQDFWQLHLFHSEVCASLCSSINYLQLGFEWPWQGSLAQHFHSWHPRQVKYMNFSMNTS